MSNSNPLNTESTHTSAIAPTPTPAAEMPEMILMALCDFLEKR